MTDQTKLKTPRRTRPAKMENYGISTNNDGLMAWEWVDEQMTKARNYWICTTRPDGRPHAAPVWGVWVDGALYFGSDRQSIRMQNLTHNPEGVVHLESGDDTVILEGTIVEVQGVEKTVLTRIADAYGVKYAPFRPDFDSDKPGLLLTLKPRTALTWLERDFPKTATRWHFD
ncbi:MAG: pyridoxamine 5'-phosphate oxidase family protein [Anaerolineae bacterium]|nr:pyridoxamine 5'-phosphate oxidase family protein [Anaerolineae bacterium]